MDPTAARAQLQMGIDPRQLQAGIDLIHTRIHFQNQLIEAERQKGDAEYSASQARCELMKMELARLEMEKKSLEQLKQIKESGVIVPGMGVARG